MCRAVHLNNFPQLLLQYPQGKSTTKALSSNLEHCLSSWFSGDIDTLLAEGHAIQAHLPAKRSQNKGVKADKLACRFADHYNVHG